MMSNDQVARERKAQKLVADAEKIFLAAIKEAAQLSDIFANYEPDLRHAVEDYGIRKHDWNEAISDQRESERYQGFYDNTVRPLL